MPLKGKKAEAVQKRLKVLFYGHAGVGKTTAALSFPSVYMIDTERGAENSQYLKLLEANNGALFQSSDFSEILAEVKSLLSEKHEYKTLVIDPLTVIYNNLVDQYASKKGAPGADPTAFGRHYQEANKDIKRLLNLLLRLDMNVIVTSHAKNEYGKDMSVLGTTFDCYKKLDYLFDLVIEIKKHGLKRFGAIRKTRIATFNEGEEFEFSYKTMAEKYGRDIIEKKPTAELLATVDQVKEVKRLIALLKVPEDVIEKWLHAANSSNLSEMGFDKMVKVIESLQNKLNGKE